MKLAANIQQNAGREILKAKNLFLLIAVAGISLMSSCSKDESITPSTSSTMRESSAANSSQRKSTSTSEPMENAPTQHQSAQIIGYHYRLIVSFESTGSGIDLQGMEKLQELIRQQEQIIGKQIVYQSHQWGKEGEVELRFKLREMDEEHQAGFVTSIKTNINSKLHPTIKVFENIMRLPVLPS